jgi:hypothetical protein
MRDREWGRDEQQRDYGRDWGRDYGREMSRDFGGRDEQWMRDERWRRELARDFMREEYLPSYDREQMMRERMMREREMMLRGEYYPRPMGRAPKGYVRSDERIKEDICDRLMASWIDAENIEIEVRAGEVTLAGMVEDRPSKRAIEDIIERVLGVKDVHNTIHVQPRHDDQTQHHSRKPLA